MSWVSKGICLVEFFYFLFSKKDEMNEFVFHGGCVPKCGNGGVYTCVSMRLGDMNAE